MLVVDVGLVMMCSNIIIVMFYFVMFCQYVCVVAFFSPLLWSS